MKSRIGWLLILLAVLLPAGSAYAEAGGMAGLVIDYGDGVVTYALVPVEGDEISGLELLAGSGISLVTVSFGGLGEAVCTIGNRGCGVGDCRQRLCQTANPRSPFWQYFRLSASGTWEALPTGASQASVTAGTVDGWSWTGDEPLLPAIDFPDLVRLAGGDPGGSAGVEAVSQTYDQAGHVLVEKSESTPVRSYAGAAVVLVVLGAAGLWMVKRKPLRETGGDDLN